MKAQILPPFLTLCIRGIDGRHRIAHVFVVPFKPPFFLFVSHIKNSDDHTNMNIFLELEQMI